MNVFRALARELFQRPSTEPSSRRDPVSQQQQPAGSLQPVRERRVAPVLSSSTFARDTFERLPQETNVAEVGSRVAKQRRASRPLSGLAMDNAPMNDAQVERAWRRHAADSFTPARRAPVNLLGLANHAMDVHADEQRPATVVPNGFLASLDDLF